MRGEVGLGQARGLRMALSGSAPTRRGDLAGQGDDALDALGHRPELGVEGDAVQLLQPRLEADLDVLVPEEAGVVQTRGQHLGVAGGDTCAAVGRPGCWRW
jgi:hypothetical protein